jgi:predicted  nucleic acid-binding Zn-ribbon protein
LSKIDKIVDYLSKVDLEKNKTFIKYFNLLKRKSRKVSNLSSKKIEIEKTKLDLLKLYYKLGKYVSRKNYNEKISDFSYDDEYQSINKNINKLKLYIKNLESKID